MKIIALITALFCLALSAPALAAPTASTTQERNAARERKYLEGFRSKNMDSAYTQYLIGSGYTEGKAVPKDYVKGLSWLRRAAENGEPKALTAIGFRYIFGHGVEMSRDEAAKYFAQAAAMGDPYGQTELGNSYLKGYGVAQDYLKAYMWLSVSVVPSNKNSSSAFKTMEQIKAKISAAELARAVEMARVCAESKFEKCG